MNAETAFPQTKYKNIAPYIDTIYKWFRTQIHQLHWANSGIWSVLRQYFQV